VESAKKKRKIKIQIYSDINNIAHGPTDFPGAFPTHTNKHKRTVSPPPNHPHPRPLFHMSTRFPQRRFCYSFSLQIICMAIFESVFYSIFFHFYNPSDPFCCGCFGVSDIFSIFLFALSLPSSAAQNRIRTRIFRSFLPPKPHSLIEISSAPASCPPFYNTPISSRLFPDFPCSIATGNVCQTRSCAFYGEILLISRSTFNFILQATFSALYTIWLLK